MQIQKKMDGIKSNRNREHKIFKLNDNLLNSPLPLLMQSRCKGKNDNFITIKPNNFMTDKQNSQLVQMHRSFYNSKISPGFLLKNKKLVKVFNIPEKFKKHNNKIQDNMTVLNKSTTLFHTKISKTCSNSFYKGNDQNSIQINKKYLFNKNRTKNSFFQDNSNKRNSMEPRTLQKIQKEIEQKQNRRDKQFQLKRKQKQKYNVNQGTNVLSKSINQLMKSSKQSIILSRLTLLQLKSYYCSILNFAKGDTKKFKYAFQIMLNLSNVTVRQTIINQCIKQLVNDGINFNKFLKTFTDIQQRLRKQAIIDYFQILLQEVKIPQISYEQLIRTFQGRMKKQIANQLTDLLYQKMERVYTECINKKQIHSLCYNNQHFCTRFYALNHQNMLNNKFDPIDNKI